MLAQIPATNFFWNSGFVSRYYGQIHHVQYQKKLMIQSWENLAMGEQTDRWRRVISKEAGQLMPSIQDQLMSTFYLQTNFTDTSNNK